MREKQLEVKGQRSNPPMEARINGRRLSSAAVAMRWMQLYLKMESPKRKGRMSGWFVRDIGQQCNLLSAPAT